MWLGDGSGVQQLVQAVVQLAIDLIVDALARDGRIELRDFGVLETRFAPPRIARNPKTGVEVSFQSVDVYGSGLGVFHQQRQRQPDRCHRRPVCADASALRTPAP